MNTTWKGARKTEKQLFPDLNDWKRARLIARDDCYVIQTQYDEATQMFKNEYVVPKSEECAELVAFNLYTDLYNNEIVKKLQSRENFRKYINRLKEQEEKDNDETHFLPFVWANCNP